MKKMTKMDDITILAEKFDDTTILAEKIDDITILAEKIYDITILAEKIYDITILATPLEGPPPRLKNSEGYLPIFKKRFVQEMFVWTPEIVSGKAYIEWT